MYPGPLGRSLSGKALEKGLWNLEVTNIRDFAEDTHKTVDDKGFGGGNGLVMKPDILGKALDHVIAKQPSPPTIYYMSPRGKPLSQKKIVDIVKKNNIVLLAGRYEGIDERVIEEYNIEELSLGDFILSGGEIATFAIMDACVRLLPDVIENLETLDYESFTYAGKPSALLEYPHYTRPNVWNGREVPEILLSGDHAKIAKWRLKKAEELTEKRRPDLWEQHIKDKI